MNGEVSEYGGKSREGHHEGEGAEDPRQEARDLIDEIAREQEESYEKQEGQEQSEEEEKEYRKQAQMMIDEAKEEHEREMADSETNEDAEYGWNKEAEKCVKDAVKGMERQKEEEQSSREAAEEESNNESGGESRSGRTEDTESYHDDGSGQMYVTKTESSEHTETKTESETSEVTQETEQEPIEPQERSTSRENTETKNTQSDSDEPVDSESRETGEQLRNRGLDSTEEPEPPEASTSDAAESKFQEKEMKKSTAAKYSEEMDEVHDETKEEKKVESSSESDMFQTLEDAVESSPEPERKEATEPKSPDESEKTKHQSEPEDKIEDLDDSIENSKTDESTEQDTKPTSEVERKISEPEIEEPPKSDTDKEDLDGFVERVKEILYDKPELDDNYDYVQDPLTGELQRVPKILSEYETEEQKQRRKIRNLFAELSEEERVQFKKLVRENAESEEDRSAEEVERQWIRVVEVAERTRKQRTDVQEVHRLYFDKGLSMLEVGKRLGFKSPRSVQRIFREQGWEARPSGLQRKSEDYEEMHRLYFKDGHTLKEIAQRFGMDRHTIGKIFREQGWITRRTAAIRKGESISNQTAIRLSKSQSKRSKSKSKQSREKSKSKLRKSHTSPKRNFDPFEVYKLYFIDGLTMMEISKKLGFKSTYYVSNLFKEKGWKSFNGRAFRKTIDVDEVYRLYYIEGLTKEEVARKLDIPESRLRKVYKEMGWISKIRKFETEDERAIARKDTVKKRLKKIKDIREEKFGIECRICGKSHKLAIHRKDGEEHEIDFLWQKKNLESVNPDEWAALCISCHRGIHWLMERHGYDWDSIESLATKPVKPRNLDPLKLPNDDVPSSLEYLKLKKDFEGTTEEMRRGLFGKTCYFCDAHYEDKKVSIHRMDGRPHDEKLTKREKYFRTLDPKDWVALCNEHHRHVHWAMDTLNLKWDDMKSANNEK